MSDYKFHTILSFVMFSFEFIAFRTIFAVRDINNATNLTINALVLAVLRCIRRVCATMGWDWQSQFGTESDLVHAFETDKPLARPHFEIHMKT